MLEREEVPGTSCDIDASVCMHRASFCHCPFLGLHEQTRKNWKGKGSVELGLCLARAFDIWILLGSLDETNVY